MNAPADTIRARTRPPEQAVSGAASPSDEADAASLALPADSSEDLRAATSAEWIEALEIRLLLEAVNARYGYDFRDYATSSLRRRVHEAKVLAGLQSVSELQGQVLRSPEAWEQLFRKLSVNVTWFFRDPAFFRVIRSVVLPELASQPFIRIWHAGCATGEEVYSTAILLHEAGLLGRCRIYATDINEAVLRQAKTGVYAIEQLREAKRAYGEAGGEADLENYCATGYDHFVFDRTLRNAICFSQHNLVTDGSFNEFDMIFARNVLIYFNKSLQDRVNTLFYESLGHHGYLALGERESLRYTPFQHHFEPVHHSGSTPVPVYRKVA